MQLSLTVSWYRWLISACQRYKTLRFDVFLHFSWPNWKKFKLSHHPKLPCQNQPKSFTSFLAYHFSRATHFPGYKNLPQFVKILYLSSLRVKFQPTECIISVNFAHFSSSPNYVRGVKQLLHVPVMIDLEKDWSLTTLLVFYDELIKLFDKINTRFTQVVKSFYEAKCAKTLI